MTVMPSIASFLRHRKKSLSWAKISNLSFWPNIKRRRSWSLIPKPLKRFCKFCGLSALSQLFQGAWGMEQKNICWSCRDRWRKQVDNGNPKRGDVKLQSSAATIQLLCRQISAFLHIWASIPLQDIDPPINGSECLWTWNITLSGREQSHTTTK